MSASNKKVLGVVYSQEDYERKITQLTEQGYSASEIHAVAENAETLKGTPVQVEEAGTFGDKLKSFVTGKSAIREAVDSLELSEEDSKRYTEDVARGGILLYTEGTRMGIIEAVDKADADAQTTPQDEERQQFIKSVDNGFDEQEDRFARGETFLQDPTLVKDERHVSFSTQKNADVEKARGGSTKAESHSTTDEKYK